MARQYTLPMSAWVNFANHIVESSIERMQEASERLQDRKYQPSDWFSDVAGFWMDGADAWWSTFQQTVAGPIPFVFIKMRPDEEAASSPVFLRHVPGSTLEATDLVRFGGAARNAPSVDAVWVGGRPNCAAIEVRGLGRNEAQNPKDEAQKPRIRLDKGLYQSSVHMDEKLVAIVQILVED
jgi:hypothetical protein